MSKINTVDEYIKLQDAWKAEILTSLRKIVKNNAPDTREAIKWAQPVYENDDGPFCFLRAYKDHINIGFWRGTMMNDPEGMLEGEGEKMRHVKIDRDTNIDEKIIGDFIKQGIRLNKELGNPTQRSGDL